MKYLFQFGCFLLGVFVGIPLAIYGFPIKAKNNPMQIPPVEPSMWVNHIKEVCAQMVKEGHERDFFERIDGGNDVLPIGGGMFVILYDKNYMGTIAYSDTKEFKIVHLGSH